MIFPVALDKGKPVATARLEAEQLEDAFEYRLRETGRLHGAIIPEGGR